MKEWLNDKTAELYANLEARWKCFWAELEDESGIESVEWIALAAVILVFLIAMMMILKTGGKTIAQHIIEAITKWIKKWTEGL
jgi:Flp pilus assembly pilin Flp